MSEFAALEAKARAGDVGAQLELAFALERAGHRITATSWLEAAAQGGHPEALALLAVRDLQGLEVKRDVRRARERLEQGAALGGNTARRLLGTLSANGEFGSDWSRAIALVFDAAKAGDWQALRYLGLLVEMAQPGSPLAEDLLLRAGVLGDGLSGFAILRRQELTGRTLAAERVFALWRAGLAKIGHPLGASVANVMARGEPVFKLPEGHPDWNAVAAALTEIPGLKLPAPIAVSENPFIRRFEKLLTVEECEYVVGLSSRLLAPATVVDGMTGAPTESVLRTNSVAVFWPVNQDIVLHAINMRLAVAAGLPFENGEMTNILLYKPGEEYRAHFDFFPPNMATGDPSGQRVRTLLVYLNADYDGGETNFIAAGHKIKGNVGDAVLFHNCDAAGMPDNTTLHAGLPVTRGQKWLLSKWYREKRFVYR
jgi:prolyl 4-hydroxylase